MPKKLFRKTPLALLQLMKEKIRLSVAIAGMLNNFRENDYFKPSLMNR